MTTLVWIILATLVISLGGLIGVIALAIDEKKLAKALLFLVSLSAGAFMGAAFLGLLPEASQKLAPTNLFTPVLVAFIAFVFIEKLFYLHRCLGLNAGNSQGAKS